MSNGPIIECIKCVNTTANPTITINKDGLCNVCKQYALNFNKNRLKEELIFLKSFITHKKYDVMVGVSGGKDSSATLYTIKQLGFTPLAFTFEVGYTIKDIFSRARRVANTLHCDYEVIDIRKYIEETERESFEKMANLYAKGESEDLKNKFRKFYEEGRRYYSAKCKISFPFVRPCQICRKFVIRAYYAEALKRGISLITIGINEWTGLSNNSYSAIRKIQPYSDRPPVYIVHLPFLLQRKFSETKKILEEIKWIKPKNDKFIDTGASACLLALACEAKAERMLGFHIDSTRLAREVTVGFISKKQAQNALKNVRESSKTVREVLEEAEIL